MLELLQSGDGSLGMLDVPELDPLDGVVIVAEVASRRCDPRAAVHERRRRPDAPFRLAGTRTALVGRLRRAGPARAWTTTDGYRSGLGPA